MAHTLATNPIGMSATPPTDWDNELLTANASSSTVVPSESGCDDWRDSDSDQLPDWYETHIAALSARDGLNSVNELTPSLVLWGSRWNLLQMLQLGADPGLPDASQADTDGDGLTDPRERQLLTQLYHWDSDGDGMADGWEDRYNLDPKLMGADVAVKSGRLDGLPDSKEKLLDPQLQLGDFVLLENTTLTTSIELLTDKSSLAVTDSEISSGLAAARGKGYGDLLDFHQQALHDNVLGRLSAARSKWSNDTFEVTKRSTFMAPIAAKALRAKKHGGVKVAVTWILEDWNELKFQGKLADAKIMTQ